MKQYFEQGYYHFKGVLNQKIIQRILKDIQNVYRKQFFYLNLDENVLGFDACLIEMFSMDLKRYVHTFRTATMLPSIFNLAYDESILNILSNIGIKSPILCQKPNLRMDCEKLAIATEYYKLPAHQDYKGMQGSINSVVISIPLVDVDETLGALQVLPESHKIGFLKSKDSMQNKTNLDALKAVEIEVDEPENFISVPQKQGDALVFSSFLLHRSGTNILDTPRYTLLLKYNDLEDKHFLEQGFISPTKMTHESVVDESLDYVNLLREYFS